MLEIWVNTNDFVWGDAKAVKVSKIPGIPGMEDYEISVDKTKLLEDLPGFSGELHKIVGTYRRQDAWVIRRIKAADGTVCTPYDNRVGVKVVTADNIRSLTDVVASDTGPNVSAGPNASAGDDGSAAATPAATVPGVVGPGDVAVHLTGEWFKGCRESPWCQMAKRSLVQCLAVQSQQTFIQVVSVGSGVVVLNRLLFNPELTRVAQVRAAIMEHLGYRYTQCRLFTDQTLDRELSPAAALLGPHFGVKHGDSLVCLMQPHDSTAVAQIRWNEVGGRCTWSPSNQLSEHPAVSVNGDDRVRGYSCVDDDRVRGTSTGTIVFLTVVGNRPR